MLINKLFLPNTISSASRALLIALRRPPHKLTCNCAFSSRFCAMGTGNCLISWISSQVRSSLIKFSLRSGIVDTCISWYCEPRRNVLVAVNVLLRRRVVFVSCCWFRTRRFVAKIFFFFFYKIEREILVLRKSSDLLVAVFKAVFFWNWVLVNKIWYFVQQIKFKK